MNDGVVLWLVGGRHDEHFVVCLLSLCDHWAGPVTVVVGDEHAKQLAEKCAASLRPFRIVEYDYAGLKTEHPGKTFYLVKCNLWRCVDYDRTVFLDADTQVLGDFSDAFPAPGTDEVRLTQFATWTTKTRKIIGRVSSLKDICPEEVNWQLEHEVPALNTGVFGFSPRSRAFMEHWDEVTSRRQRTDFMLDELTAQCIYPYHPHVVLDDRWNWSCKFSADYPDVRIAHHHGFKAHRTERGKALWVPVYERAKRLNIAGIRSWTPTKKFRAYYQKPNEADYV